jgi:hypothetical protein
MEQDLERMSNEMIRTMASDPDPERTAAFKAPYQEFPARYLALSKERKALLEKSVQREEKRLRVMTITITIVVALVSVLLLWLIWK